MERETMLKSAVAACFKAREAVNVKNVKAKLPPDFFQDFDTGAPLDDEIVFAEIQATYSAAPKHTAAMVTETPDGRPLAQATQSVEELQPFPDYLPPSEKIEPVEPVPSRDGTPVPVAEIAAPVVEESTASHAASGPGQPSPQARLDGARTRAGNLLAVRPSLINAQRAARAAVALAVRAFQEADPHRQTPAQLSAEYRATSQATRAARAQAPGPIAYVDLERKYSQGGDANAMARRMNVTGNRRGAYSRQNLGQLNRDPSRGAIPKPVATTRPTIPALAK